jgi:hypothetical protein
MCVSNVAAVVIAVAGIHTANATLPSYTMEDLDTGGRAAFYDINNSGQLVGWGMNGAFLATPTGVGGYTRQYVTPKMDYGYGINASGQIVGEGPAYMWKPDPLDGNGTRVLLQDVNPPPGSAFSQAIAINDAGSVVGNGYDQVGPSGYRAFLWKPNTPNGTNGTMVALGGGDGSDMVPAGINAYGSIVGSFKATLGGDEQPFLWRPDSANGTTGQTIFLPAVPGAPATGSASAISEKGQIVGTAGNGRGFLWTPSTPNGDTGSIVDLGAIPVTIQLTPDLTITVANSNATDINSAGMVVGSTGYVGSYAYARAFAWTPADGLVDLNTRITNGADWTLFETSGVNDAGQIIVQGWYHPPGGVESFHSLLLTPNVPEPSVFSFVALSLSCLVRRRSTAS